MCVCAWVRVIKFTRMRDVTPRTSHLLSSGGGGGGGGWRILDGSYVFQGERIEISRR